jgi:hypothetical protein
MHVRFLDLNLGTSIFKKYYIYIDVQVGPRIAPFFRKKKRKKKVEKGMVPRNNRFGG